MTKRYSKGGKRKHYKKRPIRGKGRSVIGKNPPSKDVCVIHENYESISAMTPYHFVANVMYNENVSLQSLTRARIVAPNFQWYRIVKVQYIYSPNYTMSQLFQGGVGTHSIGIPKIYFKMNRNGVGYTSLAQLQAAGAKPRLFNKPFVVTYRPNNLISTAYTGQNTETGGNFTGGFAEAKYEWLSTQTASSSYNPYLVPYYGHAVFLEQFNASLGNDSALMTLDIKITVEFKEANAIAL